MYKIVNAEEVLPKSREYYLDKAMKLKALLDSDQTGERESAGKLLADYMDKYNITWSDLDDALERDFVFPCESELNEKLLVQIAYTHLGEGHCYRVFSSEDASNDATDPILIKLKCRPRDFLEIKLDWEFYWSKFIEELDMFYRAFIERNELFPPKELQMDTDTDDNENLTEDEIRKIKGMMSGIDTYTRYSQLEAHGRT